VGIRFKNGNALGQAVGAQQFDQAQTPAKAATQQDVVKCSVVHPANGNKLLLIK
jgi:hypothetical protein